MSIIKQNKKVVIFISNLNKSPKPYTFQIIMFHRKKTSHSNYQ